MNNILEFLGSLFSLFGKKEIVKVEPIVKPKVEEKVVEKVAEPKTSIEELIEKLKDKEKEKPKEPKEELMDFELFNKVSKFTLLKEGFISDDPQDTGGLTIFGISSKWYPKEVAEMKRLIDEGKIEEAKKIAIKIYYDEYWMKAKCYELPLPMACVVFDTSINSGVSKARELLGECSGDWKYYLLLRIVFNTKCATEEEHLRGWTKRIASLYEFVYKNIT